MYPKFVKIEGMSVSKTIDESIFSIEPCMTTSERDGIYNYGGDIYLVKEGFVYAQEEFTVTEKFDQWGVNCSHIVGKILKIAGQTLHDLWVTDGGGQTYYFQKQ